MGFFLPLDAFSRLLVGRVDVVFGGARFWILCYGCFCCSLVYAFAIEKTLRGWELNGRLFLLEEIGSNNAVEAAGECLIFRFAGFCWF